jgi:hypothetical protein
MTTFISAVSAQKPMRSVMLAACFALTIATCGAQTGRVPTPMRSRVAIAPPAPQSVALPTGGTKVDFGSVALGAVGLFKFTIAIPAGSTIQNVDIKDPNSGADPSPEYKYEYGSAGGGPCDPSAGATCPILLVGFMPSDDHTIVDATVTVTFADATTQTKTLTGRGAAAGCLTPKYDWLPLNRGLRPGDRFPQPPAGVSIGLANLLYKDFGDPLKKLVINCFYQTNGLASYLNQFQSIYNAASGSTTVNAALGSLNFVNGMQVTVGTNPQVGISGASSGAPVAGVPTLAATAAAQAAQNVLNNGTIYGSDLFPLYFHQSNGLATLTAEVKEGVDLQKFNNMSITATNPSTHTFVGLEGYLQYNSSNNAPNSTAPAGSIFLGGKYGYSLMNHSYSIQNGFGGRVNSQIAQVSAGILINGVVKIAAYRSFGPSQSYIDSTSMAHTTVNNFKTWSIAIAYQKAGAAKAQ